MCVGGGHKCWRSAGGGVDRMWDGAATLVRARMNRLIEGCKAVGTFPRIMILDGASLYRNCSTHQGMFTTFGLNIVTI
eukprot:3762205-Pyramimonas_sp.AAC.1